VVNPRTLKCQHSRTMTPAPRKPIPVRMTWVMRLAASGTAGVRGSVHHRITRRVKPDEAEGFQEDRLACRARSAIRPPPASQHKTQDDFPSSHAIRDRRRLCGNLSHHIESSFGRIAVCWKSAHPPPPVRRGRRRRFDAMSQMSSSVKALGGESGKSGFGKSGASVTHLHRERASHAGGGVSRHFR